MLIIRFSRVGKKNRAHFRIVLTEKSNPVKGKFNELLGSYNPFTKELSIKKERVDFWLSKGIKATDSVHNLLVKKAIVKGKKRLVRINKPETQKDSADQAASAQPVVAPVA